MRRHAGQESIGGDRRRTEMISSCANGELRGLRQREALAMAVLEERERERFRRVAGLEFRAGRLVPADRN